MVVDYLAVIVRVDRDTLVLFAWCLNETQSNGEARFRQPTGKNLPQTVAKNGTISALSPMYDAQHQLVFSQFTQMSTNREQA